jgi:hypothetical protein
MHRKVPQVDAHHRVPGLHRQLVQEAGVVGQPRVVHREVEAAKRLHRSFDQILDLRFGGDVARDELGDAARRLDLRHDALPAVGIDIRHHDPDPLAGQVQRGRPADPGRRAGDDHALARQRAECRQRHRCLPCP